MKYNFDPNELTSEKSLWDIFIHSRGIKSNKFNKIVIILSIICLTLYVYIFQKNIGILAIEIRSLSLLALNFSITVLGFLIAGFTIFATLSKPDMLLKMMDIPHVESGLPYLKYNFFALMRVFIYYIVIIFFYIIIILLGNKNGIISLIVSNLPESSLLKNNIIKICYIITGISIIYLVLLLKTFIFNIYSIVMNQLRWELYIKNNERTKQFYCRARRNKNW